MHKVHSPTCVEPKKLDIYTIVQYIVQTCIHRLHTYIYNYTGVQIYSYTHTCTFLHTYIGLPSYIGLLSYIQSYTYIITEHPLMTFPMEGKVHMGIYEDMGVKINKEVPFKY